MARTIKAAYTEINPILLAEYCYYFSKSYESIKGGFGVYKLTEKEIDKRLSNFTFQELIKISGFLIPQNIGSNSFYKNFESAILNSFPNEVTLSQITKLAKNFSNYNFFNKQLYQKIENQCIKLTPHFSNKQINYVLWSFSRNKKGSKELFKKLEIEYSKRINLFNARSLTFGFYSFCIIKYNSEDFFEKFKNLILNKIEIFDIHMKLKILSGISTNNIIDPNNIVIIK